MYILTLEKVASGPEQLTYVYQVGEHVIGRGPQLQCTSKKVSRKHALLKVTQNDGVFIESTHNNPCYHKSKDTQSIQIVSFSKCIKLNNEDKISLDLEHGWFRTKISKSNEEILPADITTNKRELVGNNEASDAKKIKLNNDAAQTDTNNENITELEIDASDVTNDTIEPEVSVRNDTVEAEVATRDVRIETQEAPRDDAVESEATVKDKPDVTNINSNTEIKQEPLDELTNELDVPEMKQEPADTSTEMAIKDKPEDDLKNNEKQDKCAANANDTTSASTSLGNGSSRRDRCWYGSSCYRKNPTHRATFSHPKDADYDSDPNDSRAICCYGINCYRRNKLHREKYRHPGQDKIPAPPSKKKRKQQKSPKTNETRNRKAKTNTVDYYDDDEDDYDLDDPFINDGDSSDEYEPNSSDTESDEDASSQSQDTEELEDTKQLLKDARKFARRK